MNRTFSFIFSCLLLILIVGSIFFLLPSDKDKEGLEKMRAVIRNHGAEVTEIQQERFGVRKEMIVGTPDKRLQTRVTADKSVVDIEKKGERFELIEKLSGVTYVTQETPYPNHVVRVIKAETAIYHHHDEQITADHVHFFRYLVDHEELPATFENRTPSMQGDGDKLTVDLKGKKSYRLSRVHGQIFDLTSINK